MDNLRINKTVFRIATTDLIRKLFSGLFLHRYVRAVKYQKCSRYPDHKNNYKSRRRSEKGMGTSGCFSAPGPLGPTKQYGGSNDRKCALYIR